MAVGGRIVHGAVAVGLIALAAGAPLSEVRAQVPAVTAPASTVAADRAALLAGVDRLIAPGALPGQVAAFGENTFVFLTGREGKGRAPLFAVARYGKGRVIAGGHGGFFGAASLKNSGNARLLANCAAWLADGREPAKVRVGVLGDGDAEMPAALRAAGYVVTPLTAADLPAKLSQVDVLCGGQSPVEGRNSETPAALTRWVQGGGALFLLGPAWGWQQLNPGKSLTTDHTGNQILFPLGLAFTDGTPDQTGPGGAWLADVENAASLDGASARSALALLGRHAVASGGPLPDATLAQVTNLLSAAMAVLPADGTGPAPDFARRVRALCDTYGGDAIPTKQNPVTAKMPYARLKISLEASALRRVPADQVKAHPAAATFPGPVPAGASRVTRTVAVDTGVPEWHSTGLYAAPGEVVTVTIPKSAAGKGLAVRIGAHKDGIWPRDAWWRFPEVTREERIQGTSLRIANPFGGAVFVVVPERSAGGSVPVTVAGAVEAPYFVKGKISVADWKATVRNAPGPWAELQGDRCILTVPSSVVRDLDDPDALMAYWDEVMDAAADLYGIPRERKRPERYCVDVQISAGYMHSGYPIMTFDDVAKRFVTLSELRAKGGNTWGFYHELGHNHQRPEWTWDGCGEVTNNLFSLYGSEKFNAETTDYDGAHNAIAPKPRRERLAKYVADGAPYEEWKRDPWIALTMFIQLRQTFGWEPFTAVFQQYRTLADAEKPRTDTDKHDQFLVRFSKQVGKNLGPFFTAWGIPTTEQARAAVKDLPAWMPPDWPAGGQVSR